MTDRREFLGAMLALFAGVVLPEPVREAIYVPRDPCLEAFMAMVDNGVKIGELLKSVEPGAYRLTQRSMIFTVDPQFFRAGR